MSFVGLDDLAAKQLMSGRFSVSTDQLNLTSGLTTVYVSTRGINLTSGIISPIISGSSLWLRSGINANAISGLVGVQISGATSGYVLMSDNSGIASWQAAPGAGGTHNLFSATHPDTLPAVVVRGDLIVGNSTPKWARLPVDTYGKPIVADGTDAGYSISGIIGNIISGDRAIFDSGVETVYLSALGITITSGNLRLQPASSGQGITTVAGDLLLNPTVAVKVNANIIPSNATGGANDLGVVLGTSTSRWQSISVGTGTYASGITTIQISGLRGFQMSGANSGFVLTQDGSGIGTWKISPSVGTTFDVMSGNSIWLQSGLRADVISGNDGAFTVTLTALNLNFKGASSGFTLGMSRNIFLPPASSGFGLNTESGDMLIATQSGREIRVFEDLTPSTLSGTDVSLGSLSPNLGSATSRWGIGFFGGVRPRVRKVNEIDAPTITGQDCILLVDVSGTSNDLALPNANASSGFILHIKKIDSSDYQLDIVRAGFDTIEGATSKVLSGQYQAITLYAGSGTWYILSATSGVT